MYIFHGAYCTWLLHHKDQVFDAPIWAVYWQFRPPTQRCPISSLVIVTRSVSLYFESNVITVSFCPGLKQHASPNVIICDEYQITVPYQRSGYRDPSFNFKHKLCYTFVIVATACANITPCENTFLKTPKNPVLGLAWRNAIFWTTFMWIYLILVFYTNFISTCSLLCSRAMTKFTWNRINGLRICVNLI